MPSLREALLSRPHDIVTGPDGRKYLKVSDLPADLSAAVKTIPGATKTMPEPPLPVPIELKDPLPTGGMAVAQETGMNMLRTAAYPFAKALETGMDMAAKPVQLRAARERLMESPEGRRIAIESDLWEETGKKPAPEEVDRIFNEREIVRKSGAITQGETNPVKQYLKGRQSYLYSFLRDFWEAEKQGQNALASDIVESQLQAIPTDVDPSIFRSLTVGQRGAYNDIWLGSQDITKPEFREKYLKAREQEEQIRAGTTPKETAGGRLMQQVGEMAGPMGTTATVQALTPGGAGVLGAFDFWRRQGKGMILKEAFQNVDPATLSQIDLREINDIANRSAIAYSAIEFLTKTFGLEKIGVDPGRMLFKKYFGKLIQNAPTEKAASWWGKNVAGKTAQQITRAGGQSFEEGMQKVVEDVFRNQSATITNAKLPEADKKKLMSFNEIVNSAANEIKDSYLPMLILGGGAQMASEIEQELTPTKAGTPPYRELLAQLNDKTRPDYNEKTARETTNLLQERLLSDEREAVGIPATAELENILRDIGIGRVKDMRRLAQEKARANRIQRKVEAFRPEYDARMQRLEDQELVNMVREQKEMGEYAFITPEEAAMAQKILDERKRVDDESRKAGADAIDQFLQGESKLLDAADKYVEQAEDKITGLYDQIGNAESPEAAQALFQQIEALQAEIEHIQSGEITRAELETMVKTGKFKKETAVKPAPPAAGEAVQVPEAKLAPKVQLFDEIELTLEEAEKRAAAGDPDSVRVAEHAFGRLTDRGEAATDEMWAEVNRRVNAIKSKFKTQGEKQNAIQEPGAETVPIQPAPAAGEEVVEEVRIPEGPTGARGKSKVSGEETQPQPEEITPEEWAVNNKTKRPKGNKPELRAAWDAGFTQAARGETYSNTLTGKESEAFSQGFQEGAKAKRSQGQKKKVKRSFTTSFVGTGLTPIAMAIQDQGGIKPKSKSRKDGGEYDGMPTVGQLGGFARIILGGNIAPDEMAQILRDDLGIGNGTADTMWDKLLKEIDAYRAFQKEQKALDKGAKELAKEQKAQNKEFQAANVEKEGAEPIQVSNLKVGDLVRIDGEDFKVAEVDPETFDVTLEDGKRFGIQRVKDGQVIYAEDYVPSDDATDFTEDDPNVINDNTTQETEVAGDENTKAGISAVQAAVKLNADDQIDSSVPNKPDRSPEAQERFWPAALQSASQPHRADPYRLPETQPQLNIRYPDKDMYPIPADHVGDLGNNLDNHERFWANLGASRINEGKNFVIANGPGLDPEATELVLAAYTQATQKQAVLFVVDEKDHSKVPGRLAASKRSGVNLDDFEYVTYSDLEAGKGPALPFYGLIVFQNSTSLMGDKAKALISGPGSKVFASDRSFDTPREAVFHLAAGCGIEESVAEDALGVAIVGGVEILPANYSPDVYATNLRAGIGLLKQHAAMVEARLAEPPAPEAGLKAPQAELIGEQEGGFKLVSEVPKGPDEKKAEAIRKNQADQDQVKFDFFKRKGGVQESPMRETAQGKVKLYHGSPTAGILSLKPDKDGIIYFTDSEETAKGYTWHRGIGRIPSKTPTVYSVDVDLGKSLVIDALGKRNDNIPYPGIEWKPKVFGNLPPNAISVAEAAQKAFADGYDSIVIKNVVDTADIDDRTKSTVYAVRDPNRAKIIPAPAQEAAKAPAAPQADEAYEKALKTAPELPAKKYRLSRELQILTGKDGKMIRGMKHIRQLIARAEDGELVEAAANLAGERGFLRIDVLRAIRKELRDRGIKDTGEKYLKPTDKAIFDREYQAGIPRDEHGIEDMDFLNPLASAVDSVPAPGAQIRQEEDAWTQVRKDLEMTDEEYEQVQLGQLLAQLPLSVINTLPKGRKPVNLPMIINLFERLCNDIGMKIEIRTGETRKNTLGHFKAQHWMIRLKMANDIVTAAHEFGHAITTYLNVADFQQNYVNNPKMREELAKEGKLLYGSRKPAVGYANEGFSEFMWKWFAGKTDYLQLSMPETLKWWETTVLPSFSKKFRKDIEKQRMYFDTWIKQGIELRARTKTVEAPERPRYQIIDMIFSVDKIYKQFVEEFADIERMDKEIQADMIKQAGTRGDLTGDEILAANLELGEVMHRFRGSAPAVARAMMFDRMQDLWNRPTGPALREAFRAAGIKTEEEMYDFGRLLHALQAKQRYAQWRDKMQQAAILEAAYGFSEFVPSMDPGMTEEEADLMITKLGTPEWMRGAEMVKKFLRGLLDYRLQAGALDQKTYQRLIKFNYYTPLFRAFREKDLRKLQVLQKMTPSAFKRFKGSGEQVINPINSIIAMTQQTVQDSHKKYVTKTLIQNARTWRGLGYMIEPIKPGTEVYTSTLGAIKQQLLNAGLADTLKLIQEATGEEDMQLEALVDLSHRFKIFTQTAPNARGQVLVYKNPRTGNVEYYQVDEDLYKIISGIEPDLLSNLNIANPIFSKLVEWLFVKPTQFAVMGTTGINPQFSYYTNLLRDPQTLIFQSYSKQNPVKLLWWWASTLGALLKYKVTGRTSNEDILMYEKLGLGRERSLGVYSPVNKVEAFNLLDPPWYRKIMSRSEKGNPIEDATEYLASWMQIPEAAPRIAEIKAMAKDLGITMGQQITPEQSIALALAGRRVTGDWLATGAFAKYMRKFVPFFGPSIQGPRQFLRTFKDPIQRRRAIIRALLGYTIPSLVLWFRNKDDEDYIDMPTWEKMMFFNIKAGNQWIRIPKVFEWGILFASLPEAIMDAYYRKDPKKVLKFMGDAVKQQAVPVVPVTLKLIYEQAANKVIYTGKNIVSEYEEENLPAGDQVGPYTSVLATALGKIFKDTWIEKKGWNSPKRIDHFIRTIFGNFGLQVADAPRLVMPKRDLQRSLEVTDIPILRGAFRQGGAAGTQSIAINKLYDEINQQRKAIGRKKAAAQEPSPEDKTYMLLLNDADKAITALSRVQTMMYELDKRQDIQRLKRRIASNALAQKDKPVEFIAGARALIRTRGDRLESFRSAAAKEAAKAKPDKEVIAGYMRLIDETINSIDIKKYEQLKD